MTIKYHTTSGGSKKPKKSGGGRSIGGFFGNLVDEAHETAAGFFPGMAEIGGAILHDAKDAVDGGGHNFRTDDIGSAIRHSYTDAGTTWGETGRKWSALLRGDLDGYKKHRRAAMSALYAKPLGPILDAGSFVTLGGGAAARGAGLAAKAATEGTALRSALASAASLDPVTLGRITRTVQSPDLLGRGTLPASQLERFGAHAGIKHDEGNGILSFEREMSRNPSTHMRQEVFEAISNRVGADTPVIGVNRRVGRHVRRKLRQEEAREAAQTLKPVRGALSGLRGRERRAVTMLASGLSVGAYATFLQKRLASVRAEVARKEALGRRKNAPGDEFDATQDPVLPGLPEPDAPLLLARESGDAPDADPTGGAGELVLREADGDEPRVDRTKGDEDLADMGDDPEFANLLETDRRESLKRNLRNQAFLEKRLGEVYEQTFAGLIDNPTPKMLKAVEAIQGLSRTTTQRLVDEGLSPEKAAARATLESRIMQAAGVEAPLVRGAIRSHISKHNAELDVTGGASTAKITKPSKLDELQKNTGYNFYNARDNMDPAMFLHSARQVFEYRARLNRFNKLLSGALIVSADEAKLYNPKDYKFLDAGDKLRKEANEVYGILVDAEQVLAGTPMYDQLTATLRRSLVDPDGTTGTIAVIPKVMYHEILGEFIKTSDFVRRWIDKPTQIWRALTLNLRPAWIVNNFVGQMMLLAFANGTTGLKNYVLQMGKKGDIVDELAPELVDFGWAHESLNDIAGLGRKSKLAGYARRLSDAMGNLNAKLTDSHTRKAAWLSEMDPHVRRLQKEAKQRAKHDGPDDNMEVEIVDPNAKDLPSGDLTYEEAARILWDDERFADRITEKVLGDMIDFSDLSDFERTFIKRAIPFYSWLKGISIRTARMAADEPWKLAATANVSNVGLDALEERYGELPEFLNAMIPLSGGDNPLIATTQGLNPLMTPADVLGMMSGAVLPGRHQGPQNPLAQFNPLIKAPAEALANKDFFYGSEVDRNEDMSFLERLIKQGGNSIAQKRLVDEYLQQRKAETEGLEYDPLYEPSFRNAIAQYMGLPIRNLDTKAARARAVADAARK